MKERQIGELQTLVSNKKESPGFQFESQSFVQFYILQKYAVMIYAMIMR